MDPACRGRRSRVAGRSPAVFVWSVAAATGMAACGARTIVDTATAVVPGYSSEAGTDATDADERSDVSIDHVEDAKPDGSMDAEDDTAGCAPAGDAGVTPLSCAPGGPGLSDCGPTGESCCTSPEVPCGTYLRSYDGVTFKDTHHPATVSGFRLDKYEISVGRFRGFVGAVVAGWLPTRASGKHARLNRGKGLSATSGGYEPGWDETWNAQLPTTSDAWTAVLTCGGEGASWTAMVGANERRPVECLSWYAAYAFCIWDGGFLPSEAEWNYAAAGGASPGGQRAYPWSDPPMSTSIDCAHAVFCGGPDDVGTDSPLGDGAFGQADLAGNLWEWTLDIHMPHELYFDPCDNCVDLRSGPSRSIRGGTFVNPANQLLTSVRHFHLPEDPIPLIGARCARSP